MQTKINKKSIMDLEWQEFEEELNFLEKCLWKEFMSKQRNILKETEKIKPLKSYLTEKEFTEFVSLI